MRPYDAGIDVTSATVQRVTGKEKRLNWRKEGRGRYGYVP